MLIQNCSANVGIVILIIITAIVLPGCCCFANGTQDVVFSESFDSMESLATHGWSVIGGTLADGPEGNALVLNTKDQYASLSTVSYFNNECGSIEMWVKLPGSVTDKSSAVLFEALDNTSKKSIFGLSLQEYSENGGGRIYAWFNGQSNASLSAPARWKTGQ